MVKDFLQSGHLNSNSLFAPSVKISIGVPLDNGISVPQPHRIFCIFMIPLKKGDPFSPWDEESPNNPKGKRAFVR
jgi:hypothetical protein